MPAVVIHESCCDIGLEVGQKSTSSLRCQDRQPGDTYSIAQRGLSPQDHVHLQTSLIMLAICATATSTQAHI